MNKPILFFGMFCLLCACKGQAESEQKIATLKLGSAGALVDQLPNSIWAIYQDRDSNYWFGSNGEGVFRYDGKEIRQYSKENGLASNQIRGIQEDQSGHIFFDTPEGVSKYDGQALSTLMPIHDPSNEWTSEPGDLWFKKNGNLNAVYRYDGTSLFQLALPEYDKEITGSPTENRSFSKYGVYSIYKDKNGHLWFGTLSAGVYFYSLEAQVWIKEKELMVLEDGRAPGVRSIIEDKDGHLWLSNILHRYRLIYENTSQIQYEQLEGIEASKQQVPMEFPYYLSAVVDDKTGELWMLTYSDGVWRYDGETLVNHRITKGEETVSLVSMYQDKQGILWVGSQDAGAYRFIGDRFEAFAP